MFTKNRRLKLFTFAIALFASLAIAGCGTETVIQTVVVEVPGAERTVLVEVPGSERIVVVTATVPVATPTSVPASLPAPKNVSGTIVIAVRRVNAGVGLPRAGGADQHGLGVGETFFMPIGTEFVNPMLAKSFVIASDLSKVTLFLQEGVQFHKGYGEMTAEDAVWTMNDANSSVTPESIHGQAGDFSSLFREWKVIDKFTVEAPFRAFDVTWNSNFLNDAGQAIDVVSKAAFDQNGADWMRENYIGTGPWEPIEWIQGDKIVLRAVKDHWRIVPQFDNLIYRAVGEESTRVALMLTGEVDVAEVDLKNIGRLVKSGFRTVGPGGGFLVSIGFSGNLWETNHAISGDPINWGGGYVHNIPWISPPGDATIAGEFDDPNERMQNARLVRKALAMAIDRELINDTLMDGLGFPEYIVSASVTSPHFQDRWIVPYDPAEAGRLLDEAGYPMKDDGTRFKANLYVQTETTPGEIGDAIGGFWAVIGVPTEVSKYAYAVFRPTIVARANTTPWLAFFDEGTSNRPFDWPKGLQMSTASRGGASAGFESPYIAERFLAAGIEPDLQKRIALNTELVDYEDYWGLIPGVVNRPCLSVYNPNSIESWEMGQVLGCGLTDTENIVPAR